MNGIKESLTRKLGPLPVWAWAIIAGIAVYWYRNRTGSGGTSTTAVAPQSPMSGTGDTNAGPVPLQPGESVYDPFTGQLYTAPGGNPATTSDGTGTATGGTTAAASPTAPAAPGPTSPASPTRTVPSLRGRGARRAPVGRKRPVAPRGYKSIGLGGGFWEFLPTKRSKTSLRHKNGGRTDTKLRKPVAKLPGRQRAGTHRPTVNRRRTPSGGAPLVRQRKTVKAVREASPVAHITEPAAVNPRKAERPRPAPRPSAPKPRATTRRRGR